MILKHIFKSDRWPAFRTGCREKQDCVQLLRYLQRPEVDPEILHNDFAGTSPMAIADECEALHRNQTFWAYHVVARFPAHEKELWNPQAKARITEFNERCGIERSIWISHGDHWHGFLCAMKPNGRQVLLGSFDEHGQPVSVAMTFRQMAQRWEDETPGATQTGRDKPGLNLSRDALAMSLREYGQKRRRTPIPDKLQLRTDIQRIIVQACSLPDMETTAKAAGIEVRFRKDGETVTGISFSRGGVSIRGRDAGYTYTDLQKLYDSPRTNITHAHVAERTVRRNRNSHRQSPTPRDPKTHPGAGETEPNPIGAFPGFTGLASALERLLPHLKKDDDMMVQLLQILGVVLVRIIQSNEPPRKSYESRRPRP